MAGFIRTLLLIILFYYLFKVITRYVIPFLLYKGVEKMQRNQQKKYDRFYKEQQHKEGEVTIRSKGKNHDHSQSDNDIGEYVDFEELNDDE
ncbi:MAG: DUF4834 family protein [Chlorobi bacterium]|nr:DUF4834 family protein [Chlorobiota bacterium]